MPYLTPSELVDALTPLDGFAVTAATLGDARLANAITLADAEIDSRLSERYRVPFATPPALIVMLDQWIAGYNAVLEAAGSVPIDVRDPSYLKYLRALDILGQIADGALDLPPGTPPPDGTGGDVTGASDGYGGYPDLNTQGDVVVVSGRFGGGDGRWDYRAW